MIKGQKIRVKTGAWSSGHIPRSYWPSRKAKAKAYKYGPSYHWRFLQFESCGVQCCVRILLNVEKKIFRAAFGVIENNDTKLLCEYEFHASEPGWHCHARCGDLATIDATRNRYGGVRIPQEGEYHRREKFVYKVNAIDKVSAFNCACEFFKINTKGDLL